MKVLFILIASFVATSAFAQPKVFLEGNGQIRKGGLFSEVYFIPFKTAVATQLARQNDVQMVLKPHADYIVTYEQGLVHETFYSVFPKGTVAVEVYDVARQTRSSVVFDCPFSVNDGGNVTLKTSCVKEFARKISPLIK